MKVHVVDGTYELFRQYYGRGASGGTEAATGVLSDLLTMISSGATHVGVATDHVVESFRNRLWPGYKTGAGVPPDLLAQFPVLEDGLHEMGVACFAMVEHEADDGMASAAAVARDDARVAQVLVCTPDKDLAQCVEGTRVVQMDRRRNEVRGEAEVIARFGVPPAAIPDYLALVGDTADGFPGLPGWGAKSAAAVLARYGHLEAIPDDDADWDVPGLRGAARLSRTLRDSRADAELFRTLATLVRDVDVGVVDDWGFTGPREGFPAFASKCGMPALARRAVDVAAALA